MARSGSCVFYGSREILTGISIIASKDPTPSVCGGVAGDAFDIGTLAYGYTRDPDDVTVIVPTLVAVAGVTSTDAYCAAKLSNKSKVPLARINGL